MRIGVDLLGGDTSPIVLFEAVLQAAHQLSQSNVTFIVLATHSVIKEIGLLARQRAQEVASSLHIEYHPVSETIEMVDDPLLAIRRKKDSSLVVGTHLLKKGELDAFVSSGNTGALIASTALTLPALPGIKRPALLALLPTAKGSVAVIDVGGTTTSKATYLIQFAQMGAAYQRCFHHIKKPTVGLLNIGVESKKGTSEVREAYEILRKQTPDDNMHFIGNVEGRDVFQGGVDVLVTDGFTGNVFLKTAEGISAFILEYLHHTIDKTLLPGIKRQFSHDEHSGAIVCGVDGLVIKCHGKSSVKELLNAILGAVNLVQNRFIAHLKSELIKTSKYSDNV